MGFDKQVYEGFLNGCGVMADLVIARRLRAAQLKPVQRALAGQRRTI